MCSSRRGFIRVLTWTLLLAAGLAVCGPASGQGGGKPKPPPNIPRPIVFFGNSQKPSQTGLKRADVNGTSIITVNSGAAYGSWPRWSPDGQMIGGYHKSVDPDTTALMVMSRDGANEQAVMTIGQFNAWNLARPGVVNSGYGVSRWSGFPCWLGNNAFVFTGSTIYDASFFGGTPGTTITAARLFIVDASGTISPLTETVMLDETSEDSSPHWSPALNKIVFVGRSKSTHSYELYAINPDGTGLARITDFGFWTVEMLNAVWSPLGDRLAVGVYVRNPAAYQLWLFDVDLSQPNPGTGEGGRVTAVLPFKTPPNWQTEQVSKPSWSPDGRRIVYSELRNAYPSSNNVVSTNYVVIADVATGAETTVAGPQALSPDWDPLDLP